MFEDERQFRALATLLLVVSPLVGVVTVGLLHRAGQRRLQATALGNATLTALVAVVVWWTCPDSADSGRELVRIGFRWCDFPLQEAPDARPWLRVVFSLGVDALNRGPLLMIPWVVWSALALTRRPESWSSGYLCGLLAWEATLLCAFAAQDAVTFGVCSELAVGLALWLTCQWGGAERRAAAANMWRTQWCAGLAWMLGVIGLAVAAIWVRREITTHVPTATFEWDLLAEVLPRLVRQYEPSAQVWARCVRLLFLLLVCAVWLRSAAPPWHTWLSGWLTESPLAVGAVSVLVWPLLGMYAALRCVWPVFPEQVGAASGWIAALAGATAVYGGLLALAHSNLRQFAAAVLLSGSGVCWLGASSGLTAGTAAGWSALQLSAAGVAAWLLWAGAFERRSRAWGTESTRDVAGRFPRLAAVACLLMFGLVSLPAVGRWGSAGVLLSSLLQTRPLGLWAALGGLLLTGWAGVWLLQRVLFDRGHATPDEWRGTPVPTQVATDWSADAAIGDLTAREAAAFLPFLGLAVLAAFWQPQRWWAPTPKAEQAAQAQAREDAHRLAAPMVNSASDSLTHPNRPADGAPAPPTTQQGGA